MVVTINLAHPDFTKGKSYTVLAWMSKSGTLNYTPVNKPQVYNVRIEDNNGHHRWVSWDFCVEVMPKPKRNLPEWW